LPTLDARQRRAHTLAWAPAPLVMATLTGIAFASPRLAVGGYVAMVFAFILPLPRLMALKLRRHAQSEHRGRRR
jgi:hypothetical protein